MRRGSRRLGSATAASTALSFLDIVSAGFGGAVFLFVVFASLPIDIRPPDTGGGGRFIDILVEWPRLSAGEQETVAVASEGGYTGTIMGWFVESGWQDITSVILSNDILEKLSNCDPQNAEGIRYLVHPLRVENDEILDPNNRLDTPIENLKKEDGCPVFTAYLKSVATRTDAAPGRMALGALDRVREPLVDLHIVHEPFRGKPYEIRLSALAGRIDPGTDTAQLREEMPWNSIHVTGFDPFGRYTRIEDSNQPHTLHVRVREPWGGKWHFKAKVYSAGSVSGQDGTEGAALIKANFTVRCSRAGGGHDESTTVDLPVAEFGPIPIDIPPCEFEVGA